MSDDSLSKLRIPNASPGEIRSIVPTNISCNPGRTYMQRSFDDSWFHLFINERASSGEIMFLQLASTCSAKEAIFWAQQFSWPYESAIRKSIRLLTKRGLSIPPALQELSAMSDGRGRNCTKQNRA